MHREISYADRAFQQESRLGLYLLTGLLGVLIAADVWPLAARWIAAWGLSLPTWSNELYGYRLALLAAILGGVRTLYGSLNSLFEGRIGADLAVFGIEAPALHGHPVQHRIEDIAAISVAAMLAVQPQGPYLIAGYSFGGLVAFAMARILTEAGREVRFLSLIDTYPDAGFAPRAIAARLAQLAATPPAQLAAELGGTSRRIAMRLRGRGQPPGAGPSAGFAAMPDRLAQVVEAGRAAQVAYRPRRLALDLHFIRPITPMRGAPHDPRTRWRRLVRRMEVEIVAGDHLSMIRPGAEVAAILGRRLRQVLA